MTAPKGRAVEDRIQRLRHHIAQTQAQLRRERRKQRARERAARSQHLLTYGALVALAALDQEDPTVVLGLLLEGRPRTQDPTTRHRWQLTGAQHLRGAARELRSLSPLLRRGSTPSTALAHEPPPGNRDEGQHAASKEEQLGPSLVAAHKTSGDLLHSPEHHGIVSEQMCTFSHKG
jgi:hypothetical protein